MNCENCKGSLVKKLLLIVGCILFLAACTTSTTQIKNSQINNSEYLNLIGDKDEVLNYWVVDKSVAPKYPIIAGEEKVSGCVEFSLIIGSNGMADDLIIVKSFPETLFDKPAIEAIEKWIWLPTDTNINKQTVATTIQFDFITKQPVNESEVNKACRI
jgi:TonB family protein